MGRTDSRIKVRGYRVELAELWKQVLGVAGVGVLDDFFDLGGDSLAAATIIATMEDDMGCEVTLADLFGARMVAGLAGLADGTGPPTDVTGVACS